MLAPDLLDERETSYRILQVFNKYLQFGGEEKSVTRIRSQLSLRHELTSCTFDSENWINEHAPTHISQVLRMFYNPSATNQLADSIARANPDAILLHNLYPVGSPGIYKTALKMDVPVIQYIHNFRPFSVGGTLWANGRLCENSLRGNYWDEIRLGAWQNSVLKSSIFAAVLKFLHSTGWLSAVKGWIAISRFMHDKFIEAGIDPAKVHVLQHAWDLQSAFDETGRDDGQYVFLGRLVDEKGVGVLLETWDLLESELGRSTPELWIGGDGPLADEVRKAARMSDKVRYLGFVDGQKKRDILTNCRAMLAPSKWWEPLGLVTYEAYDYKKPMFAAASGGLSETVEHGRTGFLHEAGNSRELASQILAFEALPTARRLEMGREGRRWLEANANPNHWQENFRQILDATLAGGQG